MIRLLFIPTVLLVIMQVFLGCQAERDPIVVDTQVDPQEVAILPEQGRFREPIERELREHFSPERFNSAMQILNRYGSQEGIRKLFDADPELAKQFEKHFYRKGTSRNGGTK